MLKWHPVFSSLPLCPMVWNEISPTVLDARMERGLAEAKVSYTHLVAEFLSKLRQVDFLLNPCKSEKNTFQRFLIIFAGHGNQAADCIGLPWRQVLLAYVVPIWKRYTSTVPASDHKGVFFFKILHIPVNRLPRNAKLVGKMLNRIIAPETEAFDDLLSPLVWPHRAPPFVLMRLS